MNNKTQSFIFGIFLSVSVSICGYFYINPTMIYANDNGKWKRMFGMNRLIETDYTNFKYSVLISIVISILLFTFIKLFTKKSEIVK